MDKIEVQAIAGRHLDRMREISYEELKRRLRDNPVEVLEEVGPSGVRYQLQIDMRLDGKPGDNIRVLVAIHDAGLRAFHPLLKSFIKAPDGTFVGE